MSADIGVVHPSGEPDDSGAVRSVTIPSDLALLHSTALRNLAGVGHSAKEALAHSGAGESVRRHWLSWYVLSLVGLDSLSILLGGLVGRIVRNSDQLGVTLHGVNYTQVLIGMVPAWLAMFTCSRTYESRHLGLGSEEYRRVVNAGVRFTALLAVAAFLFKWDVGRGLVMVGLPTATALALIFRWCARRALQYARVSQGVATHRVLVVGDGSPQDSLARRLSASPGLGYRVVGTCEPIIDLDRGRQAIVEQVVSAAQRAKADTVAVAHGPQMTPEVLRRIAWSLEGTGIDLLVAPALTDIAGPRINIRPVSGLPLLQVAVPEFSGMTRILKTTCDIVGSAAVLVLASPLMIAIALTIRLTSPGPALFRQTRIGKSGTPFTMFKFRSMYADAEQRLGELTTLNDHGDGVLFKLRNDPRITTVGTYLRKFSLDELPQLLNVVRGQMSLVGPRPPLPTEVERYEMDVHRRLLVKPGLTGLWQVSGRSDLNWEETVRLDLYYVENWSTALDVEILWKTVGAVFRGAGAR